MAHEQGDDVEIAWRSFLLRPSEQPRDLPEFTAYTRSWLRPAEMEPRATFSVWTGEHEPPTHSVPPAVAGKCAAAFGDGAWTAFHRSLFAAYFTDNRTVSSPEVLVAVAAGAGLPEGAFRERLAEHWDELEAAVLADHRAALELGISAVPSVVVAGRYLIPGAVDVQVYRRVLERARQER